MKSISTTILALTVLTCITHAYPSDSLAITRDSMKVVGTRANTRQVIDISRNELITGQGDDLNILLALEPTIARIPEAGSLMLVKGDGPFDNTYLVREVPLFNPGHFSGNTFADRSVIGTAVPVKVEMFDEDIAGQYSGASGSVFRFDPGIISLPKGKPRPELMINYGSLGADLTLGVPWRDGTDRYQFSYHGADHFLIGTTSRMNFPSLSYYAGLISPLTYDDIQLQGSQRQPGISTDQLLWISRDVYKVASVMAPPYEVSFPWGIGAFSVGDTTAKNPWRLTIGGSRQHYFQGKQMGMVMPVIHAERSNGCASASLIPLQLGPGVLRTRISAEVVGWNGTLIHHYTRQDSYGVLSDSTATAISRNSRSGQTAVHLGYAARTAFARYEFNINTGMFLAGLRPFLDPGISVEVPAGNGAFFLGGGVVSAQPDPRGMPTESFQKQISRTWSGNIELWQSSGTWLNGRIQAYAKWKDQAVQEEDDPAMPVWDELRQGSQLSYGAGLRLDVFLTKDLRIYTIQNISRSFILDKSKRTPSRWEIPWNNTSVISYALFEQRMTAFLIGTFSDGVPYRDVTRGFDGQPVWDTQWKRTPLYRCIDFKIQYCQPIGYHRFLTQLDAYALFDNILEASTWIDGRATWSVNVREYYYDAYYRKYPLILKPLGAHLGIRAHFRL